MLKHIGKHNQKKVVIVYRKIPNEPHMCLLVYSETMPRAFHDAVISVLESASGQQSDNLADALFRNYLPDGRIILQGLHKEGLLKKVAASQVIMTPTLKDTIRLDELNSLLDKIAEGADAVKELQEKNDARGMGKGSRTPAVEAKTTSASVNPDSTLPSLLKGSVDAALTDQQIAADMMRQSAKMKAEAASLLAESAKLEADAQKLNPTPKIKVSTTTAKKKPGRPKTKTK